MFDQTRLLHKRRKIDNYLRGELARGRALRIIGSPGYGSNVANAGLEITAIRLAEQFGIVHEKNELRRAERPVFSSLACAA